LKINKFGQNFFKKYFKLPNLSDILFVFEFGENKKFRFSTLYPEKFFVHKNFSRKCERNPNQFQKIGFINYSTSAARRDNPLSLPYSNRKYRYDNNS